jgi:hypothetical protein
MPALKMFDGYGDPRGFYMAEEGDIPRVGDLLVGEDRVLRVTGVYRITYGDRQGPYAATTKYAYPAGPVLIVEELVERDFAHAIRSKAVG